MRIARFTTGDDPRYALVEGDPGAEELVVITGDPIYTPVQPTGERVPLDDDRVRLLAPVIPRSKIIGVGRNYAAHAAEMGNDLPAAPHPRVELDQHFGRLRAWMGHQQSREAGEARLVRDGDRNDVIVPLDSRHGGRMRHVEREVLGEQ